MVAGMHVRSNHHPVQPDRQPEIKRSRGPSDVSILVVDDDPEVREGLCDALTDEGYHVATAANGADAVQGVAKSLRPDLILMDLCMPVMDGYEFLEQRVKNQTLSKIPVIVVSANAAQRIAQPGVEILRKPVDLDALLDLIRRQLRWQAPS
jgi:CheY-like chemotaxis protein